MTTTMHQFISMVASLSATGDKTAGVPFEHEADDAIHVLDNMIGMARKLAAAEKVPTKNFMEGGWSFRIFNPGQKYSGFKFMHKGARWTGYSRGDMHVGKDGKTWMFTVFTKGVGVADARPSFAEAKAEVLRLLGQPDY